MAPFLLFVSWLIIPCTGMRQRASAKANLMGRISGADFAEVLSDDLAEKAADGLKKVEAIECIEVAEGFADGLDQFHIQLQSVCLSDDSVCAGNFPPKDDLQYLATGLATTVMTMDEKRCLKDVITQDIVASRLAKINTFKAQLGQLRDNATATRVQLAFAQLASWQDSLVSIGSKLVDRKMLFPKDILKNCPWPCHFCTNKHNSMFKGVETTKFKCGLPRRHRNTPPSTHNKRLTCEKPRRRMLKFWEYKTWCTVQDWVAEIYDQARLAAMISCGSHSILSTLRSGGTMSEDLLRTCMLVEQRMAVTMQEVRVYKEFLGEEDTGTVPVEVQSLFGVFLATSTAQGLAGARDASQPPPSDDNWLKLYSNSTFTLLPPALVNSVPCDPPIQNRQILLGAFAAVVGIGSAVMLSILAVIPLVLLGGFFFILAGVLIVLSSGGEGDSRRRHIRRRRSQPNAGQRAARSLAMMGVAAFKSIPDMFSKTFRKTAAKVYHKLRPAVPAKLCPRGLLFLNNSPPICISDMDKLEAKRYTCPADESRSIVVSCEDEFDGLVAVRGEPC